MMFISVFKSEIPSERLVVTSSSYSNDIKEDLTLLLVALFQPIRQGGLSGFSKSLYGALDWSKKHVEDNLCTTSFFSAIPPPIRPHPHPTQPKKKKKDLSERWDFFEFPHTLLPRSNKVTKRSSDGTTNHLSQSIQWTGRSGAWHLYAIIHAISICTVKGKDSALLWNGKGSRVWTFCCCGVTGHGMHATVHVIFHSSSQSASLGVWCT